MYQNRLRVLAVYNVYLFYRAARFYQAVMFWRFSKKCYFGGICMQANFALT